MKLQAMATALILVAAPAAQAQTNFNVSASGTINYILNGSPDPTLNLTRGQTYTFQVNAVGHPFWIKTEQVTGTGSAYSSGVTNNGTQSGTLTFTVPTNAPDRLFYICELHLAMTGVINISNPVPTVPVTWGSLKTRYR